MTILTTIDAALVDGPSLGDGSSEATLRTAAEGRYVRLLNLPPANQALIAGEAATDALVAVVLPLDALFDDRIEAARRLRRALGGARVRSYDLTRHRRRRLKLVLRALDGHLAGEDYRGIARGLFGARVPDSAAWRTHSLRSFTVRLVREGRALMRGGYLELLRPDRRKR